jgi:hypothetical protein
VVGETVVTYGTVVQATSTELKLVIGCGGNAATAIKWDDVRSIVFDGECQPHEATPPTAGLLPCAQARANVFNRAGFRVDNAHGEAVECLILAEVFRREVCSGFDNHMVARALLERGYLDSQPPHHTKKTPMPEVGSVRFYAIRASVLGE